MRIYLPKWRMGQEGRALGLAFFLPFGLMLLLFAASGIYPFGDRSFMYSDMYHQYVPFLEELVRLARNGESLFYSHRLGLGVNFWALYAYYLASPFSWLALFWPEAYLVEFMSYFVLVKIGLTGLACCFFLQRSGGGRGYAPAFFSSFYALSGFVAAYNWNWMWLDGLILAPLLLYSLRRLLLADKGPGEGGGLAPESATEDNGLALDGSPALESAIAENGPARDGNPAPESAITENGLALDGSPALESATAENGPALDGSLAPEYTSISEAPAPGKAGTQRRATDVRPAFLVYSGLLALAIASNYYLAIPICLFLALYVLVLWTSGEVKLSRLPVFVAGSLLGAALAGFLLTPVAFALGESSFVGGAWPQQGEWYFPLSDVLARHGVAVSPERGLEHWPNIYCGAWFYLLVPLYTLCKGISLRKRVAHLSLALFMLFSFSYNHLNFLWHGANFPNSLPARQSFLYILLLVHMAWQLWQKRSHISKTMLAQAGLGMGLFFLFLEKTTWEQAHFPSGIFWISGVLALAYGGLLLWLSQRELPDGRAFLAGGLAFLLAILELGGNMAVTSLDTVSRGAYVESVQGERHILADYGWQSLDQRIEKWQKRTKNDGALGGYATASLFSSAMYRTIEDLYTRLGMGSTKVYYSYDGATPLASALLNVGFILAKEEDSLADRPDYLELALGHGWRLLQSPWSLPLGYVAPQNFDLRLVGNAMDLQNDLGEQLFLPRPIFQRISRVWERGEASYALPEDGYYFALLKGEPPEEFALELPEGERDYSQADNGQILDLGYGTQGQLLYVKGGEGPPMAIYRMDKAMLEEAISKLSWSHMELEHMGSGRISGRVDMPISGRLILSLPLDKGWSLRVNGQDFPISSFGGALMALDLPAGLWEIEMQFTPRGWHLGLGMSMAAAVLWLGICFWPGRGEIWKRKQTQQNTGI